MVTMIVLSSTTLMHSWRTTDACIGATMKIQDICVFTRMYLTIKKYGTFQLADHPEVTEFDHFTGVLSVLVYGL